MKKGIGIGVEDFSEVIKENCYYIDKTKWIGEILEDKSKIKLFTRPRRFGKTLNMSMLKYFFNVENKEENRKLFNGLDVEKSEYMSEQGQYPVIFISLKSIKAKTWEEAIQEIRLLVLELFSELKNALLFLTRILFQKYKKEVILLIDEYDSPLISAYEHHYYSDAIAFFKVFYGEALKTNQYLKMGVMTGIIRVIKAGIFSDLNNLNVYSILENEYSEFFGFNQDEVEETLEYFDVKYELFDVKAWYDGYKFGDSDVYNPWSILKFLKSKKIGSHWIDTSGNFLINQILKNTDSEIMETLEALFNGETVEENIGGNSDLSSLLGQEEIWELLLFSGYLTINEKIGEDYEDVYSLRLPNREVREFFRKKFIDVNFGESSYR